MVQSRVETAFNVGHTGRIIDNLTFKINILILKLNFD